MTPAMRHVVDARGRRMLWSDDAMTPKDRLVVEADDLIEVRDETATARFATRSDAEVHDRLVMTRAQAEWVCRELASVLGLKVMGSVK